jgi:hypothetical protein
MLIPPSKAAESLGAPIEARLLALDLTQAAAASLSGRPTLAYIKALADATACQGPKSSQL